MRAVASFTVWLYKCQSQHQIVNDETMTIRTLAQKEMNLQVFASLERVILSCLPWQPRHQAFQNQRLIVWDHAQGWMMVEWEAYSPGQQQ
jgi:hypothetical protein